jgi:hypothetical protein
MTLTPNKSRPEPAKGYTKVLPRPHAWNRPMEDLVRRLTPLLNGPSFQSVVRDERTENTGPQELFPEAYWVDELWHQEVRLTPETYRIIHEIGNIRDRRIRELVYLRDERANLEATCEAARQAIRERQREQGEKEAAIQQCLRRSDRGRIPKKRNPEL